MMAPWLIAWLAVAGPAKGEAARRAEAAFEAGDYETAASAAEQAYAEEKDPVYLWVRAQAERFGGHCEPAIEHYRQFVEAVPQGQAADAARDNIAECEQALAAVPDEPSSEPDPVDPLGPLEPEGSGSSPTEPGVDPSPEPSPSDRGRRWYRDPWGGALVGVGVVALAVGGGLYGRARVDAREAEDATHVVTYGERIDRAVTLSRAGIPVMAVGGALVVAGVVRWIVVARRGARNDRAALRPGGLTLRF